ncbi:hypothetical protein [Novipirellula artificiosorum]|uniref:hypothetical protein n=1 Tax=Novipirellula artificiosorum TaxID=2528016 RepID=UPI0011B3F8B4|nr:hypothetical protein [Novipirellula artificiosorum]
MYFDTKAPGTVLVVKPIDGNRFRSDQQIVFSRLWFIQIQRPSIRSDCQGKQRFVHIKKVTSGCDMGVEVVTLRVVW